MISGGVLVQRSKRKLKEGPCFVVGWWESDTYIVRCGGWGRLLGGDHERMEKRMGGVRSWTVKQAGRVPRGNLDPRRRGSSADENWRR